MHHRAGLHRYLYAVRHAKDRGRDAYLCDACILGALLTSVGVYDKLAKHGGAGTLVPITGFANSIVSPAIEFKSEGYILGLGAKMFIIAGPVLVYGITASVVYGIIYFILKAWVPSE